MRRLVCVCVVREPLNTGFLAPRPISSMSWIAGPLSTIGSKWDLSLEFYGLQIRSEFLQHILKDFRNAPFYIHFHMDNLRMFPSSLFVLLHNGSWFAIILISYGVHSDVTLARMLRYFCLLCKGLRSICWHLKIFLLHNGSWFAII